MMTKDEMRERLRNAPWPTKPKPPTVEEKAAEHWADNKTPTEAVYAAAADHTERAHRRYKAETMEDRRARQMAKEIAEANNPQVRAQAELDRWFQAKLDFEASLSEWDYSTGFRERRYKTGGHRGPGDSDWGL
jgi:hypothetical protein